MKITVGVRHNNLEQALRAMKKKLQQEGKTREIKLKNYYEKPFEKRKREERECIRRVKRKERRQARALGQE